MTGRVLHRLLLASVLALTPMLMGYSCGGGGGGGGETTPSGPHAWVFFDFDAFAVNEGVPMQVKIVASTEYDFQSFDIDIKVPHQNVLLHSAQSSAPFDDNGMLFVAPTYSISTGEIKGIVDFRHGNTPATGLIELAEFTMIPHTGTDSALLEFTRVKIADGNGQELAITPQNQAFPIWD